MYAETFFSFAGFLVFVIVCGMIGITVGHLFRQKRGVAGIIGVAFAFSAGCIWLAGTMAVPFIPAHSMSFSRSDWKANRWFEKNTHMWESDFYRFNRENIIVEDERFSVDVTVVLRFLDGHAIRDLNCIIEVSYGGNQNEDYLRWLGKTAPVYAKAEPRKQVYKFIRSVIYEFSRNNENAFLQFYNPEDPIQQDSFYHLIRDRCLNKEMAKAGLSGLSVDAHFSLN